MTAVILPLLIASKREVKIFGVLVALVLATTAPFFSYAHFSVFRFGGALMSLYLVGMIFWVAKRKAAKAVDGATAAYAKSRISDEAYRNACPQSCSGGYLDASRQV